MVWRRLRRVATYEVERINFMIAVVSGIRGGVCSLKFPGENDLRRKKSKERGRRRRRKKERNS